MVTLKQWGMFLKHREECFDKALNSKEYKEVCSAIESLGKPTDCNFLWFRWKSNKDPIDYLYFIQDMVEIKLKIINDYVPPETVEDCANWLLKKKK